MGPVADPEVPRRARSRSQREIGASAAVAPQPPGTGELAPGVVTTLSPRIRRVIAPNPSLMTGPGTGSYIVGDPGGDLAVIDPGPADDGHLDRLAEVGAGRIRWVLVTHTHEDHSPGVAGLVQRTGATSVGFAAKDDFVPEVEAADGWRLRLGSTTLCALHTPGHASNHVCWHLEEEATLFSGDHIMNGSTVVIAPPDGDMGAYLGQLQRLKGLGLRAIAPGHGRLITDPAAKIDEYISHRLAREAQVAGALHEGGGITVDAIVGRLYADVPAALHPVARFSVWAHLRKLGAEGRAVCADPDDLDASWGPGTPTGHGAT